MAPLRVQAPIEGGPCFCGMRHQTSLPELACNTLQAVCSRFQLSKLCAGGERMQTRLLLPILEGARCGVAGGLT